MKRLSTYDDALSIAELLRDPRMTTQEAATFIEAAGLDPIGTRALRGILEAWEFGQDYIAAHVENVAWEMARVNAPRAGELMLVRAIRHPEQCCEIHHLPADDEHPCPECLTECALEDEHNERAYDLLVDVRLAGEAL